MSTNLQKAFTFIIVIAMISSVVLCGSIFFQNKGYLSSNETKEMLETVKDIGEKRSALIFDMMKENDYVFSKNINHNLGMIQIMSGSVFILSMLALAYLNNKKMKDIFELAEATSYSLNEHRINKEVLNRE